LNAQVVHRSNISRWRKVIAMMRLRPGEVAGHLADDLGNEWASALNCVPQSDRLLTGQLCK
jgi:hypothetical protein